jgi:hypothetical protein
VYPPLQKAQGWAPIVPEWKGTTTHRTLGHPPGLSMSDTRIYHQLPKYCAVDAGHLLPFPMNLFKQMKIPMSRQTTTVGSKSSMIY